MQVIPDALKTDSELDRCTDNSCISFRGGTGQVSGGIMSSIRGSEEQFGAIDMAESAGCTSYWKIETTTLARLPLCAA